MAAPELSVVLPVYDEEQVLQDTLEKLVATLEGLGGEFEVVCVDDGSRDRSAEILARFSEIDPRVRFERLPQNRGKGAAVRQGMRIARGARAIFMDADLSTPLEEIPRFLEILDAGHDVVLGSRRVEGASITRRQPWLRETLGRGFTAMTRLLLAPGIQDFTCGFKAFTQDAYREIFRRSTLDGWAFDAELVYVARRLGLRMTQVPVSWAHEEGTKVRLVQAVLGTLMELARIQWNRVRGRYR